MNRKIVDPVEYETKVSPENKRLVQDFLIEKRSKNLTKKTLEQYSQDMRIILTYIYREFENKSLLELKKKDFIRFSVMLQDRGLSSARVNRLLSTLRTALTCFEDDDELDYPQNVAARVKGPQKQPVRDITFLTDEQINWLKERLISEGKTLMSVYLMLTYMSGKRRGEIHQVKKQGLLNGYRTNVVVGKGQKKKFRIIYDQETQDLIRKYLDERGPDDIPELFVKVYRNGRKKAVHPSTFNEWCNYMSKLLSDHEGYEIPINPHCFRHSRLDNLERQGVPLTKLKSLAKHNDISTTATYLSDRGEEDEEEIFGLSAMKKEVELSQPIPAPLPVMIDRTDNKQPVMMKKKKQEFEQMALF